MSITVRKYIAAGLLVAFSASSAFAALKVYDNAPLFSLSDSRGKEFSLGDIIGEKAKTKSKGVVISFFASWCIPCRKELPLINSLTDEFSSRGITVLLVDVKEERDVMNALMRDIKVDKPIVLSDRTGKVAEEYGVRFFPTTFFVGGDGKLKSAIYGEIENEKELRDNAGKLLK